MKGIKNFPSVLRTEYAYALITEKDHTKAIQIKEKFNQMAKKYSDSSDIGGELELMAYEESINESMGRLEDES